MAHQHLPSGSRLCYMVVGLLTLLFLLFLFVRRDSSFNKLRTHEDFEIIPPYKYEATNKSLPVQNKFSAYETELISIVNRAKTEKSHKIIKTYVDAECSQRNFTSSFAKCFQNGNVICGKRYLNGSPAERIREFLDNKNIRIAPQYQQALKEMASKVTGQYEIIIVSALSSNHYDESQAMLRELHEKIFPLLNNYLLVVYDLGLTSREHSEYQKFCRCKLLKFPFHLFPDFVKNLKCFGWKPAVIRAHFDNANLVMWMDASVRYHVPSGFLRAMEWARTYGVQQHRALAHVPNPIRVIPTAFQFFGDSPCAHLPFTQAESNWGIYRTTPLIKDIVLDSWLACGLDKRCTCPAYPDLMLRCPPIKPGQYGTCMRPQFAIAAILAKVYMEHYNAVVDVGEGFMDILRETKAAYFRTLSSS